MLFFKPKVEEIEAKIKKDLPKISKKIKIMLDRACDIAGKRLMQDAKNVNATEIKKLVVESVLAVFASSIATSVTGKEIVVTSEQVALEAGLIVNALNNIEYKIGDRLDD